MVRIIKRDVDGMKVEVRNLGVYLELKNQHPPYICYRRGIFGYEQVISTQPNTTSSRGQT